MTTNLCRILETFLFSCDKINFVIDELSYLKIEQVKEKRFEFPEASNKPLRNFVEFL